MHMALPPSLSKESRAWWHKTVEGVREPVSLAANSEVCPVNTNRSPIVCASYESIFGDLTQPTQEGRDRSSAALRQRLTYAGSGEQQISTDHARHWQGWRAQGEIQGSVRAGKRIVEVVPGQANFSLSLQVCEGSLPATIY